jgi:hypothetical protein
MRETGEQELAGNSRRFFSNPTYRLQEVLCNFSLCFALNNYLHMKRISLIGNRTCLVAHTCECVALRTTGFHSPSREPRVQARTRAPRAKTDPALRGERARQSESASRRNLQIAPRTRGNCALVDIIPHVMTRFSR